MPKYIPGEGPSNAKLMVIGEAPGSIEELEGRPFVGPSGKIVDQCLYECGSNRQSVYVTNVVKHRPPNNDLTKLFTYNKTINEYLPQLWEEINTLKPNAILAFGNTALEAVTGYRDITKYRGSILQASRANCKVIPTLHPASLLHGEHNGKLSAWKDLTFIKWDIRRAIEQSSFSDYRPPIRDLVICRDNLTLYRFLDRFSTKQVVAVDIETYHTIPICISFSFNSQSAISIPLFQTSKIGQGDFEMTRGDLVSCWKDIADLLANPKILKIGQNFKFDALQLESCLNGTVNFGLPVNGFYFDTMLGFRTLYNELPGKLEFITSVLTEEPYYKEEGKGYNPKKDKLDRLLIYNAKDAVVTFECYEKELAEIRERKLEDFFFERVMPLHPFYSRLEQRGIKRDEIVTKELRKKYIEQLRKLQTELDELTSIHYGIPTVNVNSNGLNGQVAKLIFGAMGLPLRKGTDEKTLDAILRNVVKDGIKRRVLELILEIRKVRKTIGTYIDAKTHPDGRLHTGYRIMLETGRTSTSILKPPVTTESMGLAFQTITKHGEVGADLRSMFVPDTGYVFIEPDLSQAEARVVALLANDARLLKIFEYGVDIHLVTYGWTENLCPEDLLLEFYSANEMRSKELKYEINSILRSKITDEQRQMGKKGRHAAHYAMGKHEGAIQMGISEWKAGKFLDKVHATNSNIRSVFHEGIQESLRQNNRTLTNPFGRQRQFLNKWGDDLFKEAYAQIPQSTVSDHLKFSARIIEKRCPEIQILQESHDSFLAQIEPIWVDRAIRIIIEVLETPIDFKNCSLSRGMLTIPCEIAIGEKNWLNMYKIA